MRTTFALSALALSLIACPAAPDKETDMSDKDMPGKMDMSKQDMPDKMDMKEDMAKEDMSKQDMKEDMADEDMSKDMAEEDMKEDMAEEDMSDEDMKEDMSTGFGCPDGQEPNDTKANAHPIAHGAEVKATICMDDHDLYKITLTAGQKVSATASFDANANNLDLTLFNAMQAENFKQTDTGVKFTFDVGKPMETLEYTATEAGEYYLLVFNNNEDDADYTLTLTIE